MKESIAIPIFFPASAASNSSWATFLKYFRLRPFSILLISYSMSSRSSPRAVRSCIIYSVIELKYFRALLISLDPFSTSRALFKIILSLKYFSWFVVGKIFRISAIDDITSDDKICKHHQHKSFGIFPQDTVQDGSRSLNIPKSMCRAPHT